MYQNKTGDTSYLRLRLKYLQFTYILDSSVDISSAEEFWSFEFFSFSNSWGNKSAATWN